MLDKFFLNVGEDYDNLTGIYRRDVITEYMDYLIDDEKDFTFMILDIDNFKLINDTYGHLCGDMVLKCVAESLKELADANGGVVGRYGGDEFIFVFPNIQEYEDVWTKALTILKSSSNLRMTDNNDISVTYTIGLSRYPLNAHSIDELITLADKALYRGKVKGRNCFIVYLPEKHADIKLEAIREKVFNPMFLHSKIYNMLTKTNDLEENITKAINFIGSYYLIESLCIESENGLKYRYIHPLVPKRDIYPYGMNVINECVNTNGIFIENSVESSKIKNVNPLEKELSKQKIYSTVLCKIASFGKIYGYVRADVINLDTGRIWQNEDLVVLEVFANYLGLLLYINDKKI